MTLANPAAHSAQIEDRLSRPWLPQINGMVERCHGRSSDLVQQTRFAPAAALVTTLDPSLKRYNHPIPQRALNPQAAFQALKQWQAESRFIR